MQNGNGILNGQVPGDASGSERAEPGTTGQGGILNNMPPSIDQTDSGGVDALSVSLYGRIKNPEDVEAWLNEGKKEAQENEEETISTKDGEELIHHSTGGHAAGMKCMYRVTYKGIVFMISRRWNTVTEPFPTMQAQAKSMQLMIYGYDGVKQVIFEFAELIGFEITSTRVNRVDLCVDLCVSMSEFQKAFFEKRIVACPRKGCIFFDRCDDIEFETLQFGVKKAPIKIRMYDKLEECKHQETKLLIMKERRWGGVLPQAATRIEYQITGEWLSQQFSTVTLEQLEKNIGAIAEYLVTHWFRILDTQNTKTNYNRKELSPLWQRVQRAFASWCGPAITKRIKKVKLIPECDAMRKQVRGCLKSIYALKGWVPSTFGLFVDTITDMFREEYNSFISECAERRRSIEVRYGETFDMFPDCLNIMTAKDERMKVVRL